VERLSEVEGFDYVEGKNPVLEVLRSKREVNKVLISKGTSEKVVEEISKYARKRNIQVQIVPKNQIEEKALTTAHQGILAYVSPIKYATIDDMLALAKERNEDAFIVVLDHLEDTHNLGAILRTAEGVGVHGVVIAKNRSVSINSVAAKTSAGATEYVPVARVANLVQAIEELKKNGCWVYGAEAGGSAMYDTALTGPIVLVVGGEGKGISRIVRENCDGMISIPMVGQIKSLNASVAASVALYEILRQRRQHNR
jgi:23S rRNA (guanosine2251-2'-O)-methyltransferase